MARFFQNPTTLLENVDCRHFPARQKSKMKKLTHYTFSLHIVNQNTFDRYTTKAY